MKISLTLMKLRHLLLLVTACIVALIVSHYLGYSQIVVNGILLGGLYSATALGLSLMLGVMRILNLAHGEFLIFAAYITYWLTVLVGFDPFTTIAVAFPALFMFGLVLQKTVINRVARLGFDQPIVVTFGLALVLQNVFTYIWTADTRGVPAPFTGVTLNVGILLPVMRVIVFSLSIISIFILYGILKRTHFGKTVRATMQDWEAAEFMGVNTTRIYTLAFAIGSAFAGLAGTYTSLLFAFEPTSGGVFLLKSLAVIVLAGMGSFGGLAVAGVSIGVAESVGSYVIGGGFRDAIAYGIFLLVLILKPTGLFGRY